jgi:glutamyl-tRNA synthetase
MSVRVRFAPSPTGPLHIGGLRTALYNYVFARQHKGAFILRIEDTDQTRYVEGAEDYIQECLKWAQIEPDESPVHKGAYGPYRQSERLGIYREYVQTLVAGGHAYYAFDTAEELEQKRAEASANKLHFSYDSSTRNELRNSLSLSSDEVNRLLSTDTPYVIRFKIEPDQQISIYDEVRETVSVNSNTLDDKVLFKSDGMPTYHLANVVDDHLMEITHVIRGEEWLPSLPLHHLLYEAFGWTAPTFAHLPLILRPDGKGKLSKRDGEIGGFPVYPLGWKEIPGFKESGFLSAPLLNFLALLGWSTKSGDEALSLQQMSALFSMQGIQKAGARFDIEKLRWFNQQYLQGLSNDSLAEYCLAFSPELKLQSVERIIAALSLAKERLVVPQDLYNEHRYFFEAPKEYDQKAASKQWKEDSSKLLNEFLRQCEKTAYTEEDLEACLTAFSETSRIGVGKVMTPLRLALVGALKGPSVYALMHYLGKDEVVTRVAKASSTL